MSCYLVVVRRASFAVLALFLLLAASAFVVRADDGNSTTSSSPVADCTLVNTAEIETLLGTDVEDADETSRKGGVCSFTSRSASTDGNVSYAIVTPKEIARRRPYFRMLQIRCGGVRLNTPNGAVCAAYRALAKARTTHEYFAARTEGADTIEGIGEAAATTGAALYVLSGATVIEASVRREDSFDLDRSKTLARMLLARLGIEPKAPTGNMGTPSGSRHDRLI